MDVIWNVGNKELFVRKISVVKMMRNVSKKIKKSVTVAIVPQ